MTTKTFKTVSVSSAKPVIVSCKDQQIVFPLSIAAHPGAGGSLLVECSLHPNADVSDSPAVWFPWIDGVVTTDTLGSLASPVAAIRLTAETVDGSVELAC